MLQVFTEISVKFSIHVQFICSPYTALIAKNMQSIHCINTLKKS